MGCDGMGMVSTGKQQLSVRLPTPLAGKQKGLVESRQFRVMSADLMARPCPMIWGYGPISHHMTTQMAVSDTNNTDFEQQHF